MSYNHRLIEYASFCSFLPTFLIFFIERLWIVFGKLLFTMFTGAQHADRDALLSAIEFTSTGIEIGKPHLNQLSRSK